MCPVAAQEQNSFDLWTKFASGLALSNGFVPGVVAAIGLTCMSNMVATMLARLHRR